jgi:signal peptidase II
MPFKLLISAGLCLGLDQAAKTLVARGLAPGQSLRLTSWLTLRRLANHGGLPLALSPRAQLWLWGGLLTGVGLILRQGWFFQHPAAQVGLGLALGGAASNVYDQLRRGAVLDFLDLGWWPVFNCADVAITLGVIIALIFFP